MLIVEFNTIFSFFKIFVLFEEYVFFECYINFSVSLVLHVKWQVAILSILGKEAPTEELRHSQRHWTRTYDYGLTGSEARRFISA